MPSQALYVNARLLHIHRLPLSYCALCYVSVGPFALVLAAGLSETNASDCHHEAPLAMSRSSSLSITKFLQTHVARPHYFIMPFSSPQLPFLNISLITRSTCAFACPTPPFNI